MNPERHVDTLCLLTSVAYPRLLQGKIVLHIDSSGRADKLPFGIDCGPHVIVRVQPLKGELSRYSVSFSDEPDEVEEDIVHTAAVPNRIVHTSEFENPWLPSTRKTQLCPSSPVWALQVPDRASI